MIQSGHSVLLLKTPARFRSYISVFAQLKTLNLESSEMEQLGVLQNLHPLCLVRQLKSSKDATQTSFLLQSLAMHSSALQVAGMMDTEIFQK